MKKVTMDGNEACASISYMFTEVAGIYPITPSSPMAEHIDEWSKDRLNIFNDHVKVVEMQSEAGASGLVHGSLQNGCYTSTYTASQGLLLMIPNMYKMAGEMLPCVMHVAARSLSTHALSIFGDHQDIYATRSTGFCMLASSSVQDCANIAAITHLSAIKSSMPFLHFFDGFRTSHEIDKIELLEMDDIKHLVDNKAIKEFRNRALNPLRPYTIGTAQNDDIYFQATEAKNKYYDSIPDIVNSYMESINKIANTNYKPFNYYGCVNPNKVIVAMGSVCETIKETIDFLNSNNYKVGLIEVHLYRPFSIKYLKQVLPKTVKKIAVLDRTKEIGREPLYLDIKDALSNTSITIVGGRYGLSSKNTNPSQIKAVYDMLDKPVDNFTIGIDDDVTNLSLKLENINISSSKEMLIYGFGSDGMVSACKSIMKIVGDNTNKYVQGYFQYDSKKSGGVTKCHLRFNDNIIRSTYYVENPYMVVVTKETYLDRLDCLDNIQNNGILILNTIYKESELKLNDKVLDIIKKRNINLYIINAYDLASTIGLSGKISTIMESIILSLANLVDYDLAVKDMKEYAKKRYFKKGEEVINKNYKAIDSAIDSLVKVDTNKLSSVTNYEEAVTNFDKMERKLGDTLKVSDFNPKGIFKSGTSNLLKPGTSDIIPKWDSSKCIECTFCSLYCPHGVIRPYLLSEEEYNNSPNYIKERCKKNKEGYFVMGISAYNCTGCGVCKQTCPTLAITMENLDKNKEQKVFDYLNKNIKTKNKYDNTLKSTQFKEPKFAFSGACAGCGETAYIKLLTQMFGDNLVISNATGCSSIYGGSAPVTPYKIPWASSLFEDNAEYAYGMLISNNTIRNRIKNIMLEDKSNPLYKKWLKNPDSYENTKYVYDNIGNDKKLAPYKDYIINKVLFAIGGDGWAYDIGFSGIDHVLASGENINILVLDTQVYSNTGGQSSKASCKGAIASFASTGKQTNKKDLAKIALTYPNAYVAQISLGANPNQVMKVFKEAVEYNGPSIIIAYAPCISHGIKQGLTNSVEMEKLAVKCGYFLTFHNNPNTGFILDSKNVDFNLYEEFLNNQTRYSMLKVINPDNYSELLKQNKEYAINTYEYYKDLENVKNSVKD